MRPVQAPGSIVTLNGELPTKLANAVSDAIHTAIDNGMKVDEAVGVALGVAVTYGRAKYGDGYVNDLSRLVLAHWGRPLPKGDGA